jgi:hypothetical protein
VKGLEAGQLRAAQDVAQVLVEVAVAETLDAHYTSGPRSAWFLAAGFHRAALT